jgi:uncharacterized membrane protein YbhN (UPF0104 family)
VLRKVLKITQWAAALVIVGYTVYRVAGQWSEVRDRVANLNFHWLIIIAASAIVLAVYALLIEAWRRVLAAWDTKLSWLTSARIWFASSLGKYVPGYIWSLTAMGFMARQKGASGVAAAGSSILVNLLNLVSGLAVILICGSKLIPHAPVALLVLIAVLVLVAIMPRVLPWLSELLCKVTKRQMPIPRISAKVIWLVLLWTGLSWVGYGIAFQVFAQGTLDPSFTFEKTLVYIAVYTGAYILGLVSSPVAIAGLGVREGLMIEGLQLFGVMSRADAVILAITCRLWLTVLEVIPGLIALAITQTKIRTRHA